VIDNVWATMSWTSRAIRRRSSATAWRARSSRASRSDWSDTNTARPMSPVTVAEVSASIQMTRTLPG
jgi:hypothetical protein